MAFWKQFIRNTSEHRSQVINYLKATGKRLGLLVNFGSYPKIQYERFVNQGKEPGEGIFCIVVCFTRPTKETGWFH